MTPMTAMDTIADVADGDEYPFHVPIVVTS